MELQDKIFHLHNQAHRLLHIECSGSYLYADDLAQLNKDIHNEMNELYPLHGSTPEQDASLCLALLLGYSVSLYASLEDDLKGNIFFPVLWNFLKLFLLTFER